MIVGSGDGDGAARVGSGDGDGRRGLEAAAETGGEGVDGRRGIEDAARRGPSEGIVPRKKKLGASFFFLLQIQPRTPRIERLGLDRPNVSAGAPAPSIALKLLAGSSGYDC